MTTQKQKKEIILNAAERDFFSILIQKKQQILTQIEEAEKTIQIYIDDVVQDHDFDLSKKWEIDKTGLNIVEK